MSEEARGFIRRFTGVGPSAVSLPARPQAPQYDAGATIVHSWEATNWERTLCGLEQRCSTVIFHGTARGALHATTCPLCLEELVTRHPGIARDEGRHGS